MSQSEHRFTSTPSRAVIAQRVRVHNGFLKVDEVTFRPIAPDGATGSPQTHEVVERGHAVAVLLHNVSNDTVCLVRQIRAPLLCLGLPASELFEVPAGMVDPTRSESPIEALVRETMEEVGYGLKRPAEPICTYYSSPGMTTEMVTVYFAEVTNDDRKTAGGGIGPSERIAVTEVPYAEFKARIVSQPTHETLDSKLFVAGQWLVIRDALRPKRQLPHTMSSAPIPGVPKKTIGIITGDICDVTGVSVWVNSENTHMMMDRFFDKTVSGTIRRLGAETDETGDIVADLIGDELADQLGRNRSGRFTLNVGDVIATSSGALETQGVRKIVHVATVKAPTAGAHIQTNASDIQPCVKRALTYIDENGRSLLGRGWGDSVLIPLIGSGDGRVSLSAAAEAVVAGVWQHFIEHPKSSIDAIWINAYSSDDLVACQAALQMRGIKVD